MYAYMKTITAQEMARLESRLFLIFSSSFIISIAGRASPSWLNNKPLSLGKPRASPEGLVMVVTLPQRYMLAYNEIAEDQGAGMNLDHLGSTLPT
jgi:hypothetical protein